jgi:hypothetical protein
MAESEACSTEQQKKPPSQQVLHTWGSYICMAAPSLIEVNIHRCKGNSFSAVHPNVAPTVPMPPCVSAQAVGTPQIMSSDTTHAAQRCTKPVTPLPTTIPAASVCTRFYVLESVQLIMQHTVHLPPWYGRVSSHTCPTVVSIICNQVGQPGCHVVKEGLETCLAPALQILIHS